MPKRNNYWFEDNLLDFLKAVIAEYKKNESEFYGVPDCVYSYKFADVDYEWQYQSFEELLTDLKEELDDQDLKGGYTVRKQTLQKPFIVWEAHFDKKHRLMSIYYCGDAQQHDSGFEGLWFDIPTPFRKGDILVLKSCPTAQPFVLVDMPNWTENILKEQGEYNPEKIKRNSNMYALNLKDGDLTDMSAYALFADKDKGTVFHDHPMPYIDCEYYKGKLDGGHAVLNAISKYLKDVYGLEYLITQCRYISDKCRAKSNYFDF